jgi:CheY-like chemotaxis protein
VVKSLPIIFLTALKDPKSRNKVLVPGALAFLQKPVTKNLAWEGPFSYDQSNPVQAVASGTNQGEE